MLLVATLAGALAAQAPFPTATDALKSYLGLQDSQIESLRQLRQQQTQAIQSLVAELAARQRALREQLDRGVTDTAALGRALLEIEGLRKRLTEVENAARNQALAILSSDQRAKLDALEQARKLEAAVRQAIALGLLAPPTIEPWPGPGVRGFGPEAGPGFGPWRDSSADGVAPMRGLRRVPPLPR
ncbi:MAG: hypothetical protein RMI94_04810 [Bryobacterales bacterium]|nr:hypothetical protein [Bryobacteraceae bacterium]MDW8129847.1 hypothetical protein [Bryobacterales bacterium]